MGPLISYFKLALYPGRGMLFFALRTIVAGLLCLYLAFVFDLEQPKWALMTVIIISLPLAGMTLKRSFAQLLGTTVGAAVAVAIMALFPQGGSRARIALMSGEVLEGTVESIAYAITDRENQPGNRLLANVNPSYTWVKLAQRIPVRLRLERKADAPPLRAGTTATVTILE